jgi:hypothetical protein
MTLPCHGGLGTSSMCRSGEWPCTVGQDGDTWFECWYQEQHVKYFPQSWSCEEEGVEWQTWENDTTWQLEKMLELISWALSGFERQLFPVYMRTLVTNYWCFRVSLHILGTLTPVLPSKFLFISSLEVLTASFSNRRSWDPRGWLVWTRPPWYQGMKTGFNGVRRAKNTLRKVLVLGIQGSWQWGRPIPICSNPKRSQVPAKVFLASKFIQTAKTLWHQA